MAQFGILGPLTVTSEAGAVEIRAHKQRVLLALLLVHANRVVATDRLVVAQAEAVLRR